jgi:hypothetical protein
VVPKFITETSLRPELKIHQLLPTGILGRLKTMGAPLCCRTGPGIGPSPGAVLPEGLATAVAVGGRTTGVLLAITVQLGVAVRWGVDVKVNVAPVKGVKVEVSEMVAVEDKVRGVEVAESDKGVLLGLA